MAILGQDMRRLLREHPDIAVKLVIALGRRLREANERLARQSFQTVQSRVASVLSQLVGAGAGEGAGESTCHHRHPGGPRAARRVGPRVRQPLPRRPGARRGHHAGPRAPDRPRARRARRAMSTEERPPVEREFSAGGVVGTRRRRDRDRAPPPRGRRPQGARAAQGPPRRRARPPPRRRSARSARRRASTPSSSGSSATSATGTSAEGRRIAKVVHFFLFALRLR